jgi:ketosteroid isomerase-like protein
MKKTLSLFLIFISTIYSAMSQNNDQKEIEKVLVSQTEAWNKGDIEKYMEGYWKSDSLKFIGKNGLTTGWNATLERYKKSYPGKAGMGKLDFELLSEEKLGTEHYLVIGKWHLQREKDELAGHFSLIWKKIDGRWVIIADHSS